jgi:serine-type D-Ala-D-Ala carboxypeptidase
VIEIRSDPTITSLLSARITAGDFPSAVYLVAEHGQIVFAGALGEAVREPERIPATFNTIYDLASLTKPLITTLLCARRIELGEVTLDSSVAHYLPEFDRADKHMITVGELLTHTSGLPAWRPLYVTAQGKRDAVVGAIASENLEYPPGTRVIYSDLGFITLGFLLERLTGIGLAQLAEREIISALGLQQTFFNPPLTIRAGISGSEIGNRHEQETCKQMQLEYGAWRENLIWGEVHDGNAYFLGGAAGHAGLFATASETLRLAQQFMGTRSELLKPETCRLFSANMTPGLEEDRSIGWQLASTRDATAGPDLAPESFGHLGFTGTSCWIDPGVERVFILLTNRTHAHAIPFVNINAVRREFHHRAVAALETSVPPAPAVGL